MNNCKLSFVTTCIDLYLYLYLCVFYVYLYPYSGVQNVFKARLGGISIFSLLKIPLSHGAHRLERNNSLSSR